MKRVDCNSLAAFLLPCVSFRAAESRGPVPRDFGPRVVVPADHFPGLVLDQPLTGGSHDT